MKHNTKTVLLLTFFLLGCGFMSCQKNLSKSRNTDIITDHLFENGIFVQGNSSANPQPYVHLHPFGKGKETPLWCLPQWGSRNILTDGTSQINNDTIIYQNSAKRIYFYRTKDHSTLIGLEVFASSEYNEPRKLNEDWVHLLLEQKYSDFVWLKNANQLEYRIKAKLNFCENRMGDNFDPGLHTAQITQFFTIQNRNESSSHFGDFLWFGLPLYDYRYRNIEQYAERDLGKDDASKKFIFSVAGEELYQGSMHDYQWITIAKDIFPLIKKAFFTAQNRGYMQGTTFDELCITSMNIGWEVPGTFNCGIVFECPSLIAR